MIKQVGEKIGRGAVPGLDRDSRQVAPAHETVALVSLARIVAEIFLLPGAKCALLHPVHTPLLLALVDRYERVLGEEKRLDHVLLTPANRSLGKKVCRLVIILPVHAKRKPTSWSLQPATWQMFPFSTSCLMTVLAFTLFLSSLNGGSTCNALFQLIVLRFIECAQAYLQYRQVVGDVVVLRVYHHPDHLGDYRRHLDRLEYVVARRYDQGYVLLVLAATCFAKLAKPNLLETRDTPTSTICERSLQLLRRASRSVYCPRTGVFRDPFSVRPDEGKIYFLRS